MSSCSLAQLVHCFYRRAASQGSIYWGAGGELPPPPKHSSLDCPTQKCNLLQLQCMNCGKALLYSDRPSSYCRQHIRTESFSNNTIIGPRSHYPVSNLQRLQTCYYHADTYCHLKHSSVAWDSSGLSSECVVSEWNQFPGVSVSCAVRVHVGRVHPFSYCLPIKHLDGGRQGLS